MTNPLPLKDWEREYALRIRGSVNELRRRRGWSIARLGDELRKLGWSLSLDTLNGMLSSTKRSSFTVGEVMTLAAALNVAPTYLMLGLPSTEDLPASEVIPSPDVATVWGWVSGRGFRGALEPAYFGPLDKYAEALTYARWHNALWIESDGAFGQTALQQDLVEIANSRARWSDYVAAGYDVPDVPELPAVLVDAIAALENVAPGRSVEHVTLGPFAGLSDEHWLQAARDYIEAYRRSEFERSRLLELGGNDAPAANSAE
ncbi:helix-turn-helix domain-containing protein [Microbacterium hominis]|uniref:helix-turn-helix domain-containing protein n=1 Tax=Microbacterium hominis TaxID=162426 RepID=UPI00076876F8|nr:helix-turn-helix transcriptional regulator [Microbacterium hominis]KXC05760.1 hypothetical protein MhomT_09165 [Microbacterium hominis]